MNIKIPQKDTKQALGWFVLIVLAVFIIAAIDYYEQQSGRFYCNDQSVGIALIRGGYHSWRISYSDGMTIGKDGKWKHLWRWPRIEHVDFRQIVVGDLIITNNIMATNVFK